jgi:hypothetical protein
MRLGMLALVAELSRVEPHMSTGALAAVMIRVQVNAGAAANPGLSLTGRAPAVRGANLSG